jgi:hypothetical protein
MRFSLRRLLFFVVIAGVAFMVYRWLPNELTIQELNSIRPGMTEAEVLELVGRPDEIRSHRETPDEVDWTYNPFFGDTVRFKDGRVVSATRF